jgi:hypothetical protein
MESKDKKEELKHMKAELEMLLAKVEGLLKVYQGLKEERIKSKIEIEKESSTFKVKLLNPEMLYDPIETFEFSADTSVGEMFEKILNSEKLRNRLSGEIENSLFRIANVVRELLKHTNICINENTVKP